MGKASRRKATSRDRRSGAGRSVAERPAPFVARPFQGLPGETDWVALREVVPAATATVRLAASSSTATVATVLPMAWSGMRRNDGELFVSLQSGTTTGDASRDVAQVLLALADVEAGTPLPAAPPATESTPRLQGLLDLDTPFEVTVHEGFDFWLDDTAELSEEGRESLDQANASAVPTTKLAGTPSAYWCRIGARTQLRWVLPDDEDAATDALARLHAAGADGLGEATRLLGAFRACGLLVPVWDLDPGLDAAAYEEPVADLAVRLHEAITSTVPLGPQERRARAGLLSRQITLR
ncbi:MAG TPA: DUF5926 family protein [Dermatophilaceae bacterium]|nr:DUF5926 family protein [Dermatophilaceae bacterium]